MKLIEDKIEEYVRGISAQFSNINKVISENLSSVVTGIREAFQKLPTLTKDVVLGLHASGWYAYWPWELGVSDVVELHDKITSGDFEYVDEFMCEYVNNAMPEIHKTIKLNFPERYRILKYAFDAHNRGEYALSIPVFLSQAEGISVDVLGKRLFSAKKGIPITSSVVSAIELDEMDSSFLEPLKTTGPINATESDKGKFIAWFNRHEVLHGVSTDYDTKINSYKSISLLHYLSGFVYGASHGELPTID